MQTRNRIIKIVKALFISLGLISLTLIPNVTAIASPPRAGNITAVQGERKAIQTYNGYVLSDGQFVYGPNVGDFDLRTYVENNAPHLMKYADGLYGRSEYFSINPKVYLTLMEIHAQLISNPTAENIDRPFFLNDEGFFSQMEDVSNAMFEAYYLHLNTYSALPVSERTLSPLVAQNGNQIEAAPETNAGTYAILAALAKIVPEPDLSILLDNTQPSGFYQTYKRLFPDDDPTSDENQIATPEELTTLALGNLLQLPYERGASWQFNGVHDWGNYPDNPFLDASSIDFSPSWPPWDADTSNMWVVAAASGIPTQVSDCQFKILHNNGWETVYYHLEGILSYPSGWINQGDRIGVIANTETEALCNSGRSTGPHLHFALRKDGAYAAINGTSLSGWLVHSGRWNYDEDRDYMWLEKAGVKKYADDAGGVLSERLVGILFASTSSGLWQIDPVTGDGNRTSRTNYEITDMAFSGDRLYGISFSRLFTIDPVTGSPGFIGWIGYNNVNALTSGLDGTLYAATTSGAFLRINKSTGAGTFLGSFGAGYGSSGDLAMGHDGVMYASVSRSGFVNNWLVRINLSNGNATPIGQMGESGVFGLDFKGGNLYGVTSSGYVLAINPTNGISTRVNTVSLGASFGGASTLGPLTISVGGPVQNTYDAPRHQSTRVNYPQLNNGPVRISNADGYPIIAAERMIYKVLGVQTSYSEMMGLPGSQLDTTYWLPWYNNTGLDTQIRVANASNVPATVRLYIGGVEKTSGCSPSSSPFMFQPGESIRISCAGVNSGPVKLESDQNIVAAERVIYKVLGVQTSYSEMMGLPGSQLDTTYWLPWYNNTGLDTQLRVANASNVPATVRLYIGGAEKTSGCTPSSSPFMLQPGESIRISCTGVNNGPVKLESDQNIVAAERVIYKVLGVQTSYSEMMGLPDSQLDTTYWLPWYNNTGLDTQIRFGMP